LREGVMKNNMMEVLGKKAGKDQLRNILSGLLHQDRNSAHSSNTCTRELVKESLKLLKADWNSQKTGVTILTALAQTQDGATIIEPRIPEIIRMILPENSEGSSQNATTTPRAKGPRPRPASKVMGPACALRNLALNKSLQQSIRSGNAYRILRDIYLSGTLIAERETLPWRINTPTKSDVTIMLEKMIKAVEGELSEEDLMIGDTLPPGIQHWNRVLMFLGYTAAGTALFPVALGASIGFSALSVVALIVGWPSYYVSAGAFNVIRRSRNRKKQQDVVPTKDAFINNLVWEEGDDHSIARPI